MEKIGMPMLKRAGLFLCAFAKRLYAILGEKRCRVCGAPCPPGDAIPLCPECAAGLTPVPYDFCPCCGQRVRKNDARRFFCRDCLLHPPPWQEIHFFGPYERILRELLVCFKFSGDLAAGQLVGMLLAQSMPESFYGSPHILVPIPLSKKRLRERGFNQALELARPVVRRFSFPLVPKALTRIRDTLPQRILDSGERRINVAGAFAADADAVAGKHVLLLDDVMTTGATMREAAATLLAGGAASIGVLLATRTLKNETGHAN